MTTLHLRYSVLHPLLLGLHECGPSGRILPPLLEVELPVTERP